MKSAEARKDLTPLGERKERSRGNWFPLETRSRSDNGISAEMPRVRWGCSSAGRAPALQAGGQEFDPPHLHQGRRKTKGRPTPDHKGL